MIVIYRDSEANAIFIEDANGAQFLNNLQAFIDNPSDTTVTVVDSAKGIDILTNVIYSDIVDDTSTVYGANSTEVVNALNAVFSSSGTPLTNVPVITSSNSINITQGDSINYELLANFGVGFEWDNLPSGVVTVEGNVRKIIGGSGLIAGTYTPTMKAVNYNGQDSETLTITVASPPYSNTKSVKFNNNDYCNASALTSNPFYRASNGVGSADAWSVSVWFKGGTSSDQNQTIISFGGTDKDNEGRVWVYWNGNSSKEYITLKYGSENNWLKLETPDNSFEDNTWKHIFITYDGGTTGVASGQINDYYGRFEIWIDGVSQTLNKDHSNNGWDSSIKAEQFRIGEVVFGGKHLRNNCFIDEVGVFNSDQSANVSDVYNGGTTHDLALLANPPVNYWRMGDGDTFPDLQDSIGTLDFEMFNMTSADIVNDVP